MKNDFDRKWDILMTVGVVAYVFSVLVALAFVGALIWGVVELVTHLVGGYNQTQLISEGDRKSGEVAWGRPGTWPGEALLVELVDTGDSSPPASGRLGSSPREGTWCRRLSKR